MNPGPQNEGPSPNQRPKPPLSLPATPTPEELQLAVVPAVRSFRMEGVRCFIDFHTRTENGVEILEDAFVHVRNPFGRANNVYSLLDSSIALRKELLNILVDGAAAGLPADDMLRQLADVVPAGGSSWITILHSSLISRFEVPPLTLILPEFSAFAANPQGLQPNFLCARASNGLYERCTAEINHDESRLVVSFFRTESHASPVLVKQIDLQLAQEVGPAREESRGQNVKALCRVSQDIMECFESAGSDAGIDRMEEFYDDFLRKGKVDPDADVDARLRWGRVDPSSLDFVHTYASGAKLSVEVGDEVALLRIDSSARPDANSFLALIDRARGGLEYSEWLSRRDALVDIARRLVSASESLQMQALDDLRGLITGRSLLRAPLAVVLGEKSVQALTSMRIKGGLIVRTFGGRSSRDVQRICDGEQSIVLSLRHVCPEKRNLSTFRDVRASFYPDGSLDVVSKNELGHRVFGRICQSTVAQEGGKGAVIERLARAMLAQDEVISRQPVQDALYKLISVHPEENFIFSGNPLEGGQVLPDRGDIQGRLAFNLAETIARASLALSRGYGRQSVTMQSSGVAEATLRCDAAPYELQVTLSGGTISRFVLAPSSNPLAVQCAAVMPSYDFPTDLYVHLEDGREEAPANIGLVQSVIQAFAMYGHTHVGLRPTAERIERSECFAILDRLVRSRLS